MTIYILDSDPKKCAEYLDDKSLDKMIQDIAQVLCNAYRLRINSYYTNGIHVDNFSPLEIENKLKEIPLTTLSNLKKINRNKKIIYWSQWASECIANYRYLVELGIMCCREYHYRNSEKCDKDKIYNGDDNCGAWHKMRYVIDWALDNEPDLPINYDDCDIRWLNIYGHMSPLPLVMPSKYLKDAWKHTKLRALDFDVIKSYRNYYQAKLKQRLEKKELHKDVALASMIFWWTNSEKPEWLEV